MNQRSLHSLFSRIVVLALPLAAEVGCGGATDVDGGGGGDSGGADSGGSGGSGGAGTGGVSMTGGAATGGAANCVIPPTTNLCVQPRTGVVARSCVSAPPTAAECLAICGSTFAGSCSSVAQTNTTVTIQCPPTCVAGRRPPGFVERSTSSGLGAYFARAAELEDASVAAFRGLRAELRAWGAPRSLLRALSRAARDEQRHTRAVSALARRFGARAVPARVAPSAKRSLEAIALENVKEGCVRELYGALVATFQARAARDLQVRSAMIRIAHEETRHAALSLALQRWFEQRLDREALSRVAAAKRLAVSQLRREIETQGQPPRAEQAGLPTARESERLFASLAASLPGLG